MAAVLFDDQARRDLCATFDELGPSAPTLLEGWTAHDLAAHIVLREHDLVAAPGLVLPGPYRRFAERRRLGLARDHDFPELVARIRSGPPRGFFRIGWVRSYPNLNEFFVHHEDLRRANGLGPRALADDLDTALWSNARRGSRFLGRRLRGAGFELVREEGRERHVVRRGEPTATLRGAPGELLLYLFGRQAAARVEVGGSPAAVEAVHRTHFGM